MNVPWRASGKIDIPELRSPTWGYCKSFVICSDHLGNFVLQVLRQLLPKIDQCLQNLEDGMHYLIFLFGGGGGGQGGGA